MTRQDLLLFAKPSATIINLNANRTLSCIDALDSFIDLINCMTHKPDVVFVSESDSSEGDFASLYGDIDSNSYKGFR